MKNTTDCSEIMVFLSRDQAWALAELTKRISFSDCRQNAVDEGEAYQMIEAINRLRDALSSAGFEAR